MESVKKTARRAGLAYLMLGITSAFGLLCVPLVRDDAVTLAHAIARPGLLFPVRIVSDLVSQTSAVFLALLLYRLLSPVHKTKAVLMVALLLVSVPLSLSVALNDLAARILFNGPAFLSAFSRAQLDGLARVFVSLHIQGVFAVEIFWGLWLIPLGFLVFKSRFIPRVLGVTLIAAGLAYAFHSLCSLLLPGRQPALYQSVTMAARAAGELPLIFWLLVKGARDAPRPEGPSPAA